nr:uncharacterized protein LOC116430185 [Nomia melanderi]
MKLAILVALSWCVLAHARPQSVSELLSGLSVSDISDQSLSGADEGDGADSPGLLLNIKARSAGTEPTEGSSESSSRSSSAEGGDGAGSSTAGSGGSGDGESSSESRSSSSALSITRVLPSVVTVNNVAYVIGLLLGTDSIENISGLIEYIFNDTSLGSIISSVATTAQGILYTVFNVAFFPGHAIFGVLSVARLFLSLAYRLVSSL